MSALALQPAYRERLVALLGMLGSDHDGERATAARLADEHLRRSGLTWGDVILRAPEGCADPCKPTRRKSRKANRPRQASWADQAEAVAGSILATAWEREFAANLLRGWRGRDISEKQAAVLEGAFAKVSRKSA